MRITKIAVWIDTIFSPETGGGYSYYERLIQGIDKYVFDKSIEICFVTEVNYNKTSLKREIIHCDYKPHSSIIERILCHIPSNGNYYKLWKESQLLKEKDTRYKDILKKNNVDIILYPKQCLCKIDNFPFITMNWDIGHLSTYSFPEVIYDGAFEFRNNFYRNSIYKALMVLCESNAGKEELIKYTSINEDRVRVIPIFPGSVSEINLPEYKQKSILEHYSLTENRFFYYPAQFWAHKNHYTLVNAFADFLKLRPHYKLVFSGSDQGNMRYIKRIVSELKLEDYVVFAGFVDSDTVYTLYKNATAMTMVPMMGPTNMPPLEAMDAGCPVICSDFPGHREELGDAAIYIDPIRKESIINAMECVVNDREKYCKLIEKQRTATPHTLENALFCLNNNLIEAARIRSLWG